MYREPNPPRFKIICLHRDNVLEQIASKGYKETANRMNLTKKPNQKVAKVSEEARSKHINFSLPSIDSGNIESHFIDQRTFVDYCWSVHPPKMPFICVKTRHHSQATPFLVTHRSWTEHADVMAVEYDTLSHNPSSTMDAILSFIQARKHKDVEASNATKLAHDWSNVLNMDDYLAVPRWKVRKWK